MAEMITNPEEPDCLACMDSMRVRTCDDDECACDEGCCYADCPECCEGQDPLLGLYLIEGV